MTMFDCVSCGKCKKCRISFVLAFYTRIDELSRVLHRFLKKQIKYCYNAGKTKKDRLKTLENKAVCEML